MPTLNDVEAMFQPTISDFDKADILASHIPAASSPAGKVDALAESRDFNLNTSVFQSNGWGRESEQEDVAWLHSDIKSMAFYYISKFYSDLVNKGGL